MRSEAEIRLRIEDIENSRAEYICPSNYSDADLLMGERFRAEREALYWALGEYPPLFTPMALFEYKREMAAGGA